MFAKQTGLEQATSRGKEGNARIRANAKDKTENAAGLYHGPGAELARPGSSQPDFLDWPLERVTFG